MELSMWENEWWHAMSFMLPNGSFCNTFNSLTHKHVRTQPIITNDLMVNFLRVSSLTNRLILGHPQSVHTGTHKTKMFTRHDSVQLQNWTQETWEFVHAARPRTRFHPLQSWGWRSYMAHERQSHWVGAPLMRKRQTSCGEHWDWSSCFHYFGLSAQ